MKISFSSRSCVSASNLADFSSGKFSRAEDVGSNLDSMARSREPAESRGLLQSHPEPGHGDYELVDVRQQQMLGIENCFYHLQYFVSGFLIALCHHFLPLDERDTAYDFRDQ